MPANKRAITAAALTDKWFEYVIIELIMRVRYLSPVNSIQLLSKWIFRTELRVNNNSNSNSGNKGNNN